MRAALLALALALAASAPAAAGEGPAAEAEGTVVAARTLRSQTVVAASDVDVVGGRTGGAYATAEEVIGLETRVAVYAGRPLMRADLGPPALLERNQLVRMTYASGGLVIGAEGRALGRAGLGERVRVLNLDSKAVVTGVVTGPGAVEVGR